MTRAQRIGRSIFVLGFAFSATAFAGCSSNKKSLDELYAIQDRVNQDAPQVDIGAGDRTGAATHNVYVEEVLNPRTPPR